MRTFHELAKANPCRRPLCFPSQNSELSTLTRSHERSSLGKFSSSYCSSMEEIDCPNKATATGDKFLRHGFMQLLDENLKIDEIDRERVKKILHQVSVDILAREWLNTEVEHIENHAYLIGSVLPQVVLGLEYVLMEAVKRNLIDPNISEEARKNEGADPNFNPLNRLAEFLMRNNHRYHHFNETSAYVHGVRNAVAELQYQMFMQSGDHLAKLKSGVSKTKEECSENKTEEAAEIQRRFRCVTELFDQFVVSEERTVDSIMIQSAVQVFLGLIVKLPTALRQSFIPMFETHSVDELPRDYDQTEFVIYIMIYAKSISTEIFEQLLEHLYRCAAEYQDAVKRDHRKYFIPKFFASCDPEQLDCETRTRLLNLCDTYFDEAPQSVRILLRDPREWPIREYHLRVVEPQIEQEMMQDTMVENSSSANLDAPRFSELPEIGK